MGMQSNDEGREVSEETRMSAELDAMIRLHTLSSLSITERDLSEMLREIVDTAITATGADFGNIQLIDPLSQALRIAAHRGFPQWWVDFWNNAPRGQASCGIALEGRERVIVESVEESPIFTGAAREMHLKADVRAIQSTPLVSRSGRPVGAFSTHYRKPQQPDAGKLRILDLLARQAADIIEHFQAVAMLRESEHRLRLSEQRYRLALSGSPVAVWECDTDLRFTFVDKALPPVADPAQIIGKRDDEILPFDSVSELVAIKKRVLASGAGERREISIKTPNKVFHFEVVVERIQNSDGAITGLRGLVIDISERKRTEQALRSVSTELGQTLHIAATGLIHCSRDLRYLSVNPAYGQLVGLRAEQIVGRRIVEVIGADAFEVIRPYVERVLRGERVEYEEEIPYLVTGARFLRVVCTPWINVAGEVDGWVSSVSDLTALNDATKRLQEREQRLRLALQASGAGSWMRDVRTGRVDWDDRVRELYGFSPEVPASFDAWLSRVHENSRPQMLELWETIQHTKTYDTFDATFRIVRPDGTESWIQSLGRADRDSVGQVSRLTGIDLDVTTRREAEERFRESEKREAFLLRLADALRPLSDALVIHEVTARLLGEYLNVNRVSYAEIEGTDFIVRMSYANGVAPFVGRGPMTMFGEALLESHSRGEPVVVNDVRTDRRLSESERSLLLANEIAAFAGVMLVKRKQWVAAFGAHHATARRWTKKEVELIHDVAERIWEAVERARAEEALRVSEHKLRLSLRAGELGTWQYDLITGIFTIDDAARKIHGANPDDLLETIEQASRLVHPDDRSRALGNFERSIRDGGSHNHDYRVVLPNGEIRWVTSLWMIQRETALLIGVVQDITGRKRAELNLEDRNREQEHTLRLLLETASQGILSVDADGVIVMANAATEEMFGWTRAELIGRSVEQLVPPAFRKQHAAHRAAYFGAPQARLMRGGLELMGQRKDGTTFPVEISLNHVTTADGGCAIAFITDISTRKQAEKALRQSHDELERRTLQLGRLASQMTLAEQTVRKQLAVTLHDGLQQLLFSVGITLEQALKSNSRADQVALLQRARAEVKETIEAARTMSVNLFPPVLQIGGLEAALAWLAKRTQEQYGVVVSVTADPLANPAASDLRILLFEGVRELLFNAVKHARVDRVDVNLSVGPNDTIHIQVCDQGVGFDPAITLHYKNRTEVGLGLFSIQERLAMLGGHLNIDSAPGKGARFRLIVPRNGRSHPTAHNAKVRRPATPLHEQLVYDSGAGTSNSLRILVADDHAVARAGLRKLLSECPRLQVVGEAANGAEAISQAMAVLPDVIVMDVSMTRVNGIEATREIHDALPHIHIVGLSTHNDENTERSMREAGANAYFAKNEKTEPLLNYLLSLLPKTKEGSASVSK